MNNEVQEERRARREQLNSKESGSSARGRPEQEEKQRQAEELHSNDLARLYKQLAKLLHPNLEQDSERRAAKEAAMKQLNATHANRDLHAMLKMEIEWITQEGIDSAHLSDQKLMVYNAVLAEQIGELERTLYGASLPPRFSVLEKFCQPMVGLRF